MPLQHSAALPFENLLGRVSGILELHVAHIESLLPLKDARSIPRFHVVDGGMALVEDDSVACITDLAHTPKGLADVRDLEGRVDSGLLRDVCFQL